jgi:hypothetical protein
VARAAIGLARYRAAFRRWRKAQTPVVVEGGWHDALVHPGRHGLAPHLLERAGVLGLAAPAADVVVVADASPAPPPRPAGRAPGWERWAWRQLAPWVGRKVVVASSAADALASLASAREGERWVRPPLARTGRDLRATAGPASLPALAMYHPTGARRIVLAANSAAVRRGLGVPVLPPIDDLDGLAAAIGLPGAGIATVRSVAPGRRALGHASGGVLRAYVKVGPLDDEGLRREADALGHLDGGGAVAVPRLRWMGEWGERFVLATEAVDSTGPPRRADAWSVLDTCIAMSSGLAGNGAVVHGDFAPWNLLGTRTGLVVVDWENARFELDPLYDLTHFVVQQGVLGRRHGPADAVRLLTGADGPGVRYLDAMGLPAASAADLVRSYLARVARPVDFHRRMLGLLEPSAPR